MTEKTKFLVVEDDKDAQYIYSILISRAGAIPIAAVDAYAAEEYLQQLTLKEPHEILEDLLVLVLDLNLPGKSGVELLAEILEEYSYVFREVIIVSANFKRYLDGLKPLFAKLEAIDKPFKLIEKPIFPQELQKEFIRAAS